MTDKNKTHNKLDENNIFEYEINIINNEQKKCNKMRFAFTNGP